MLEGFNVWSELTKDDIVCSCNLIEPIDVVKIHQYLVDNDLEDSEGLYFKYSYCLIACWWHAYSRWMDASYMCVDDMHINNALSEFPINEFCN